MPKSMPGISSMQSISAGERSPALCASGDVVTAGAASTNMRSMDRPSLRGAFRCSDRELRIGMHLLPQHHAMRVVNMRVNKNDIVHTHFVHEIASRMRIAR
jgi:hypothetical protein